MMQETILMVSRVFVGILFMIHGRTKMFGGVKGFAKWLKEKGIPFPFFSAASTAVIEFWGGLLLVLGLFTRYVAILLVIVMTVATLVNIKDGKKFKGGWELDVLLILFLLLFIF